MQLSRLAPQLPLSFLGGQPSHGPSWAMELVFCLGFLPISQFPVYFTNNLETPPDALILESPFTNIREEAKSHPFSVASTGLI